MKSVLSRNRLLVSGVICIIWAQMFVLPVCYATKPRLNLFPKNFSEHIGNAYQEASSMENNLRDIIQKLETQATLYRETGCDGSSGPGCQKISDQISDNYLTMLTILKGSLPKIKKSIDVAKISVEETIRKELGKKSSPADIQKLIENQADNQTFPKTVNGRRSLSSVMSNSFKMIALGRDHDQALLAAEIYLDSKAVLKFVDLMEGEIAHQESFLVIGQMYGTLTPEMIDTVDQIKTVIFGEYEEGGTLPENLEKYDNSKLGHSLELD
jgi:hypothetical protein